MNTVSPFTRPYAQTMRDAVANLKQNEQLSPVVDLEGDELEYERYCISCEENELSAVSFSLWQHGWRTAPTDVAEIMEADAIEKREAEAIQHPQKATIRVPLTTPVRLYNGQEGVITGHSTGDVNRYRVSWFSRHFWAARHQWVHRARFEVMELETETPETAEAIASV